MLYRPTASQQDLSVHLDRRLAAELPTGEVSVMRWVDIVVTHRLIHVLVDVESVEEHRSVLIRHEVSTEPVHRHLFCHQTHKVNSSNYRHLVNANTTTNSRSLSFGWRLATFVHQLWGHSMCPQCSGRYYVTFTESEYILALSHPQILQCATLQQEQKNAKATQIKFVIFWHPGTLKLSPELIHRKNSEKYSQNNIPWSCASSLGSWVSIICFVRFRSKNGNKISLRRGSLCRCNMKSHK